MRGRWTTGELTQHVCDELRSRQPIDEVERRDIDRFVTDLAALDDPFSEQAGPLHVTGSGFVVGPRGVILLHHRSLERWMQPGGHVDAGETPWDAARREVVEETGLDVRFAGDEPELVHVSVHEIPNGHVHYDLRYLFDGGDADPVPPPGESEEVHWFDWTDAIVRAEPGLEPILAVLRRRFESSSAPGSPA